MKNSKLELKVAGKLDNLAGISDFIAEAMRRLGTEQYTSQAQLAVDEACTNIINHSYDNQSEKPIEIHCSVTGNDLVIGIRDWGKPFDPDSIPPPDTQAELSDRKVGGLGVFLIRQMMDEVK
ncbi:ATP-binding protein, partial [Chloroflexota bacterium]